MFFQQSPIYYDGFAEEFFSCFMLGASLVFTDTKCLKNISKLVETVNRYGVTVWPSTPLVIGEVNRLKKEVKAKKIVCSGDALRSDQIDWLINRVNIYNMYGLTETTVCATCHLCKKGEKGDYLVGYPIEGYTIRICDENMKTVADGENGEILIGGEGVGKCLDASGDYVSLDGETTLYYRTGDMGRIEDNGEIRFLGRNDSIVKRSGNRVNLDEVVAIISGCEGIQEVAAFFNKDTQQICLFYVSESVEPQKLQEMCGNLMPGYMKPDKFVCIDNIPLSATGKIDYNFLRNYNMNKSDNFEEAVGAVDDFTKKVIDAVLEICGEINDYRTQTFEDLGINSFLFMMLLVSLEEIFGVEMNDDVMMVDEDTTIEQFVQIIHNNVGDNCYVG